MQATFKVSFRTRAGVLPLLWLFGLGCVLAAPAGWAAARPNVLFIAADDLRMNLGCSGDPVAKTPNLDRLARRGVTFERAYCQQALCNPSRASVLTGLRPDTLRVWNLTTHFRETTPRVVTLPQHFMQQGYFTQNVGKIFHNYRTAIEGDPASWSVPAQLHFASHAADVAQIDGGEVPPNTARTKGVEARDVPDEAYFDGRVAAAAIRALRECRARGQPFFLGVGFWKPHTPFNPPKRYWDMYRREDIPAISNPTPPSGAPAVAMMNANDGRPRADEDIPEVRHGYYAATSYLDAQVGKVIDEAERLGLLANTVIVFWSDHGFHLGEQGLWGKTSNFENAARVPLIVVAPQAKRSGTQVRGLVELLDLYPTLLDLCGLPPVAGLEGLSLRAMLDDPAGAVKPAAYTQAPRPPRNQGGQSDTMGYSLRNQRYRYTEWRAWNSGRVQERELYDHQVDSAETVNRVGDVRLAEIVRELAAGLARQFPPAALPDQ
jgi:iduronate 2-sulfatase